MKILVIDDHALFRAGLRLLLASMQRQAQVFEAATVSEAVALARLHPDLALCLLDLSLHGENGLDAITALKAAAPDVGVVVVSAADDAATIRACIDAGAMSFVPKKMSPETLTRALRRVLAGDVYLPDEVMHADSRARAAPAMSPRQKEVLRGLARGLPTKSIARELNLSEHTVKEHIGLVFQALGVHNRTEAVITASGLGLGLGLPLAAPSRAAP